MQWYLVALLLTVITSSQGILTMLSQSNGGYEYDMQQSLFLLKVLRLFLRRKTFQFAEDGHYLVGCWNHHKPALLEIYGEFLMKKNNDTLYGQNTQLYTFGSIFNIAKLLLDDFRGGFEYAPWWQRLFKGFSITTWSIVLNVASTGLLVSWLMKYADNIVKVYFTTMAMLLLMVLSVFLFNFGPTLQANMLVDLPASKIGLK